MNEIVIKAYGSPAPQGSKRHVGNGRMIESSKAVKPWRQDVKAAAEIVMAGRQALDAPVAVTMTFTLPKPQSAPKRRTTWPSKRPDLSKLMRSTEDALTDAGVWVDDSLVVRAEIAKTYPLEGPDSLERPGVVIRVVEIDGA